MYQQQIASLIRRNAELVDQTARLEAQVSVLQADRQNQYRQDIGSIVAQLVKQLAHQIKNPMTAIGIFLQTLPEKFDDAMFRKEFLPIAIEEHHRINRLIESLLDMVEDWALRCEWIDLDALIESKIRDISAQSGDKSLPVEQALPNPPVDGLNRQGRNR